MSNVKDIPARPTDRYVSTETLASLLDCSPSTVSDYAARGLLPPARRIGNLKRWYWPEVLDFLDRENAPDTTPADDPYIARLRTVGG